MPVGKLQRHTLPWPTTDQYTYRLSLRSLQIGTNEVVRLINASSIDLRAWPDPYNGRAVIIGTNTLTGNELRLTLRWLITSLAWGLRNRLKLTNKLHGPELAYGVIMWRGDDGGYDIIIRRGWPGRRVSVTWKLSRRLRLKPDLLVHTAPMSNIFIKADDGWMPNELAKFVRQQAEALSA